MKKSIGDPYDPLGGWFALELGIGVALFAVCTVGFRTTLGLGVSRGRLAAAAAALATIPLGTQLAATGQLAVLTAIVVAALVVEARHGDEVPVGGGSGRERGPKARPEPEETRAVS